MCYFDGNIAQRVQSRNDKRCTIVYTIGWPTRNLRWFQNVDSAYGELPHGILETYLNVSSRISTKYSGRIEEEDYWGTRSANDRE